MTGLKGPDLGKVLTRFARTIESASVDTVSAAAGKAKVEQLKVMRRDSGGDLKLSGVGRSKGRPGGAKIGVNYKVHKASVFGVSATASIKATGPLPLINNDTAGRVIRSAYSRGRARRGFVGPTTSGQFRGDRRAVLNIPGIGFRRSARHPGTKGKDTWQRGRKQAEPVILKAMTTRTTATIKRGMKP